MEEILMSTEVNNEEVVESNEEAAPEEQPQSQAVDLHKDMKVAYVVGLSKEDNFIFQVYGENKGLVELMGIHQHASKQVEAMYNNSQGLGDALTRELGALVVQLGQKMDQLLKALNVTKPANKL